MRLLLGLAAATSFFTVVAGTQAAPPAETSGTPVPLVAAYSMEPDPAAPTRLADAGPLHIDGRLTPGTSFVPGGIKGFALRFSGENENTARIDDPKLLHRIGSPVTVTAWVRPDAWPAKGQQAIFLTKRPAAWMGTPFNLGVGDNGGLVLNASNGRDWSANAWTAPNTLPPGKWTHVALTHAPSGERVLYVNGAPVERKHVDGSFAANAEPLIFGREGDVRFVGALDEVHLFAAALTPDQVRADRDGRITLPPTLATRAATAADFALPTHFVNLRLVRFDSPIGFRPKDAMSRQLAVRKPGPDAVDWPRFTLDNQPLWASGAEQGQFLPLREEPQNRPILRQGYDHAIQPGNHWLRALGWIWGRRFAYTTERTARTSENEYELWTFPVKISGAGAADVRDVTLSVDGRTIYENAGTPALRSLTLLLPANEPGHPYSLRMAGRPAVSFNVGLAPVTPGKPKDVPLAVRVAVPGPGSPITVASVARPERFPNGKEWDADTAALDAFAAAAAAPVPFAPKRSATGMARYLGVEVPRSPFAIHTVNTTHGMSGGHFYGSEQGPDFPGTLEDYARYLADIGYDRVFERVNPDDLRDPADARSYERWLQALLDNGVGGGLNLVTLNDANQAFYSYTLPDFYAPKIRDAQIVLQRFARFPNLVGAAMGADNGGYVPYWDWAPPIPNRPWGEAFSLLQPTTRPGRAPSLHPAKEYEYRPATVREFEEYIARYDQTFTQYGRFAGAVRAVNPAYAFATQSFGSSPGVGGRGGYPWATIPARPMHQGLPILQAYDWDETDAVKPLHNVALLDRLRSYFPGRPAWSLQDDFLHKFGREARQRQFALALTRGIQSIGPNWLAHTHGPAAVPDQAKDEKELFAWIHKYGGAYALSEPVPSVGVLYVHGQAVTRPSNAPDPRGPHEGKTTEALFLCHAAGWPAKIITPEEIRRGLPPSIKAIVLVGLPRLDDSWHWWDGLEGDLKRFVARGGRLLLDDESDVPASVGAVRTGMVVRAYVTQGGGGTSIAPLDPTPELIERNRENAARLRAAMNGVPAPIAASDDPTVWAIPTRAGDVDYITVVNFASEPGKSATKVVKAQVGTLRWAAAANPAAAIYDVRLGRRISRAEARRVDLMRDAFQYYAVLPAPVGAPVVAVRPSPDGFFVARPSVPAGGRSVRGVPVEIIVTNPSTGETTTLYGASGLDAKLPVRAEQGSAAGAYSVRVRELLSGQQSRPASVRIPAGRDPAMVNATPALLARKRLDNFARGRADVPAVVALTPVQASDPQTTALAGRVAAALRRAGRKSVRVGRADTSDVVLSLQPTVAAQRFPQWRTVDADLVLLGTPKTNVLLLDQARGYLLPGEACLDPRPGQGMACVTLSPFVGERHVLNLLAGDAAGLAQAVRQMEQAGVPPPLRRAKSAAR